MLKQMENFVDEDGFTTILDRIKCSDEEMEGNRKFLEFMKEALDSKKKLRDDIMDSLPVVCTRIAVLADSEFQVPANVESSGVIDFKISRVKADLDLFEVKVCAQGNDEDGEFIRFSVFFQNDKFPSLVPYSREIANVSSESAEGLNMIKNVISSLF